MNRSEVVVNVSIKVLPYLKEAIVCPILKMTPLNPGVLGNYQSVFNFPFCQESSGPIDREGPTEKGYLNLFKLDSGWIWQLDRSA